MTGSSRANRDAARDEALRRLSARSGIPRPPVVNAAEHVSHVLRRAIIEGLLAPGTQLSEQHLGAALGVSRNTLREGFRLLTHDRLLVHHRNRGVFVPRPDAADLADLYRLRQALEGGALRVAGPVAPEHLRTLAADVAAGDAAASRRRWRQVGTANMDFHEHLLMLAGSPRIVEIGRQVLAETRLAFLHLDAHALHEPFLARNKGLLALLRTNRLQQAAEELQAYLRDSEQQVLATLTAR
ncbi:GntR family transcriptional regulator [Nocardioides coralli]|uniref:GntR family transcriptional regulator n=1 Tax=Nocardioides coralli TaxID=2872154 RepID=UPI001CA4035D|nr:GntR family transcriptional regulator [Nocardioides coralli]QZY29208.1 GntR family transcriptional regulator [Nocardioides coralli]